MPSDILRRLSMAFTTRMSRTRRRLSFPAISQTARMRKSSGVSFRQRLLRRLEITVVVDVGANVGQYAQGLRGSGYGGRIISLEPMKSAYEELRKRSADDAKWETIHVAAGSIEEIRPLNISANSYSSSLLPITRQCLDAAPDADYSDAEMVKVQTLDSVAAGRLESEDRVWVKIDVQGAEREVLEGAPGILDHASAIETELSMVPLYSGQALIEEMIGYLRSRGFVLADLKDEFRNPTSDHLLQANGIFLRAQDA